MDTTDPALVARARNGDVEAFGELFHGTQRRIYNFVRHMIARPEDAADLTQKVYVRAWQSLRNLRADGAFLVWLHRIALNIVRDSRKRAPEPTVPLDSAPNGDESPRVMDIPDWSQDPERIVLTRETQEFVRRAVAALPDIHREVVALHHLEGMEVAQIAEVLGISHGTVLSRLARARENLRRKLDPILKEGTP
ncbi:MAG: sigma-70 family RNA polymerase sigma factor [Verrucomicrobiae bacterium]|nr:sigma-70 family RNA polymerase sigma factor [Verrucomicrobiae bacterium]